MGAVALEYGHDKDGKPCWHRQDDMKLFIVQNTNRKRAYVVAASSRCARYIALWADHLRDFKNGEVFHVKQERLALDEPFQSALRRAVKGGFPGLITRVGDSATILGSSSHGIMGQVYMPISSA